MFEMSAKYISKAACLLTCACLCLTTLASCRNVGKRSTVVVCRNPSPDTLQSMYEDWLGVAPHESFSLLPQMEPLVQSLLNTHTEPDHETRIAGQDDMCEAQGFGPVYQRSTCGFHYVSTENMHRYPVKLVSAKCNRCDGCAGAPSAEYGCFPIPYYAKVLVRGACVEGVYQYTQAYEELAAGCTCAHKPAGQEIVG